MPASAHSREASNIRRDQSAVGWERGMNFLWLEAGERERVAPQCGANAKIRPEALSSLGGFAICEGDHRLRMQAVKRADELPPEHFEAMQAAPFLTAKVEVEGAPLGVRVRDLVAPGRRNSLPIRPGHIVREPAPAAPSKRCRAE